MGRDTLSDLLGTVRLRAAVFYYVSCWRNWATEAPPACEIAAAVMPGADHVMAFHMVVRGSGWAAVSRTRFHSNPTGKSPLARVPAACD